MKVTELNCGSLYPRGGADLWGITHFVCRCLLVETGARLIAVDTGIGLADIRNPEERLGTDWMVLTRPTLDPAETLVEQLSALGHRPADLTDVILTHQHRDHVGGLTDVPWARVHATPECRAAIEEGERVMTSQFQHEVRWAPAPTPAAAWRGFDVFDLAGIPEGIQLVGLPGHARGHAGVRIAGAGPQGRDLLHVGDAMFHHAQVEMQEPPAVTAFVSATQFDPDARLATEHALRALDGVHITTSHDPTF